MGHKKLLGLTLLVLAGLAVPVLRSQDQPRPSWLVLKKGFEVDTRSAGRMIADQVAASGQAVPLGALPQAPGGPLAPQIQMRGGNLQVNHPGLDNIQQFTGFRPFIEFTQSETSLAARGANIVATYNSSANQPLTPSGSGLAFIHRFLSGFSNSTDGGKTWTSGFMPPVPGSIFTFGDPAIDVDRLGNFHFSGLGTNAGGQFTIQVNKSIDGGQTWSDAVVVQQDNGGDKEWIAVGKDPLVPKRDNIYVTWSSFQTSGVQLRFGRSTDGGATWATKTIFAPTRNPNPAMPQNSLQFSQVYVDPITGRLYVAFIHFSNADEDFLRILASNDAGETFGFLNFNAPGSLIPDGLPILSAGELLDMGSGGIRLGIHAGPALAGRFGLRQFVQTARLVTQPAFASYNNVLYLAWSNSTGTVFGDPSTGSNIMLVRSSDGGATWSAPIQVNPTLAADIHHVLPSLAVGANPNSVHISYYTQHTDETIDVDLANSLDGGSSFPGNRTLRVTSTNFVLAPTVIRLTGGPIPTTNYDRTIVSGYSLGEYLSVKAVNGSVHVLWGDLRNSVTHPVSGLDPLSGQTHSQQDVFFQRVMAQ